MLGSLYLLVNSSDVHIKDCEFGEGAAVDTQIDCVLGNRICKKRIKVLG